MFKNRGIGYTGPESLHQFLYLMDAIHLHSPLYDKLYIVFVDFLENTVLPHYKQVWYDPLARSDLHLGSV